MSKTAELNPIAKKLSQMRKRLELKQVDFAKKLGTSQPTYNGWEQGNHAPRKRFWPQIAKVTAKLDPKNPITEKMLEKAFA